MASNEGYMTYFLLMGQTILDHIQVKCHLTQNVVANKIRKKLKLEYAKKPGLFPFLDYDLVFSNGDENVEIIPKNLFTVLLFNEYTMDPTIDKPFKFWKKFVIVYDENCTGYFMA
jgi:hypothetical protein